MFLIHPQIFYFVLFIINYYFYHNDLNCLLCHLINIKLIINNFTFPVYWLFYLQLISCT